MLTSQLEWISIANAVEMIEQQKAIAKGTVLADLWASFWRGEFDEPDGSPRDFAVRLSSAHSLQLNGTHKVKPDILVAPHQQEPMLFSREMMLLVPWFIDMHPEDEAELQRFERLSDEFIGRVAQSRNTFDGEIFAVGYFDTAAVRRSALVSWLVLHKHRVPAELGLPATDKGVATEADFLEWATAEKENHGLWPPTDPEKTGQRQAWRQWAVDNGVDRKTVSAWVNSHGFKNPIGRQKSGK